MPTNWLEDASLIPFIFAVTPTFEFLISELECTSWVLGGEVFARVSVLDEVNLLPLRELFQALVAQLELGLEDGIVDEVCLLFALAAIVPLFHDLLRQPSSRKQHLDWHCFWMRRPQPVLPSLISSALSRPTHLSRQSGPPAFSWASSCCSPHPGRCPCPWAWPGALPSPWPWPLPWPWPWPWPWLRLGFRLGLAVLLYFLVRLIWLLFLYRLLLLLLLRLLVSLVLLFLNCLLQHFFGASKGGCGDTVTVFALLCMHIDICMREASLRYS